LKEGYWPGELLAGGYWPGVIGLESGLEPSRIDGMTCNHRIVLLFIRHAT